MVISELALGLFTNLLYESFKNIPEYISDISSKVYDKAIEEFSNNNYKLTGIQIDTFFRQKNVEKAIKKYLKNPDKLDCSNILINEFFELFSEEDFSHEDADLILNSFFEIIDAEIEKEPELRDYLELYLAKKKDKTTQEINQGVQELSKDVKGISRKVQEEEERKGNVLLFDCIILTESNWVQEEEERKRDALERKQWEEEIKRKEREALERKQRQEVEEKERKEADRRNNESQEEQQKNSKAYRKK